MILGHTRKPLEEFLYTTAFVQVLEKGRNRYPRPCKAPSSAEFVRVSINGRTLTPVHASILAACQSSVIRNGIGMRWPSTPVTTIGAGPTGVIRISRPSISTDRKCSTADQPSM